MGTHPIFESDFDCLTGLSIMRQIGSLKRVQFILSRNFIDKRRPGEQGREILKGTWQEKEANARKAQREAWENRLLEIEKENSKNNSKFSKIQNILSLTNILTFLSFSILAVLVYHAKENYEKNG